MNTAVPILLAQSPGQSLSEGFRSHGGMGRDEVLLGLLMVAALVAGIWAVSRLLGLRRQGRVYNNPWQLFWSLCKAHHFNWSDSWLLRRVARHQDLRDPARLFLEVELWDEQILGPTFALEFARLRAFRAKLFSSLERNASAEPPAKRPPAIAASPLFQRVPTPTLDLPPWTESHSVEM